MTVAKRKRIKQTSKRRRFDALSCKNVLTLQKYRSLILLFLFLINIHQQWDFSWLIIMVIMSNWSLHQRTMHTFTLNSFTDEYIYFKTRFRLVDLKDYLLSWNLIIFLSMLSLMKPLVVFIIVKCYSYSCYFGMHMVVHLLIYHMQDGVMSL